EGERAAPRSAEQLPAVDAEVLAELLEVFDEIPRGVFDDRGVRRAAAAAALVEQHDAIAFGIEEPPVFRLGATARTTVEEHDGFALGIAGFLPVDLVALGDPQFARLERLDFRKEPA